MKKTLTIIALIIACMVTATAGPQTVKEVTVTGEFSMLKTADITFGMATENARNDAKRKALTEVCGQRVNIFEQAEMSEQTGESFNSVTTSEIDGEIVDFEILDETNMTPESNKNIIIFKCKARVKVKKGGESDMSFTAAVNGIKSVYQENENMTFSILPAKDCYLNILIYESPGSVFKIYPNEYEEQQQFQKNTKYEFPYNRQYVITKETKAEYEKNTIVFLFTKEEFSLPNDRYTREEIEKAISRIPRDKKYLFVTTFDITK